MPRCSSATAVVAVIVAPFVFLDWSYLVDQYQAMGLKLWYIASAPPAQWTTRQTSRPWFGRLASSCPQAWRSRSGSRPRWARSRWRGAPSKPAMGAGFAFAVLILSGCYITLFGPRNEFLSFIVVTPSIALLAALLLNRDAADYRGWLLIAAALVLGFAWTLAINAGLKPAIVTAIYIWLAWLMAVPARWRALVESDEPLRAGAGDHARPGAVVGADRA